MSTQNAAVIGVDLGGTKCSAVLADEAGRIVAEAHRRSDAEPDPADVLLGAVAELRAAAADRGLDVRALAMGIPAFIDPVSDLVVGGFNVGWHGFDLRARLDAAIPEPWSVENDVNLAALGEARVGAGRGASSFVTISLGTGLGGAVVVDGRLLRGRHGAAGEIGFLMADRGQLRRPGVMGMETRVGGRWLAARARELAAADPAADPAERWLDTAAVFAAVERGDRVGRQVLEELLEHVAMTVIDVTAVLDPERVVLDGSIGRALEPYVPRLVALVEPSVLYVPEVCVSTLAPTAVLAGAVAEAWHLVSADAGAEAVRG